uniref:Uncharacterized protein n=1 Tax=Cacopsylla melanoneura TaxID=428564 RepID=A0A8D8VYF9_9HEMI
MNNLKKLINYCSKTAIHLLTLLLSLVIAHHPIFLTIQGPFIEKCAISGIIIMSDIHTFTISDKYNYYHQTIFLLLNLSIIQFNHGIRFNHGSVISLISMILIFTIAVPVS